MNERRAPKDQGSDEGALRIPDCGGLARTITEKRFPHRFLLSSGASSPIACHMPVGMWWPSELQYPLNSLSAKRLVQAIERVPWLEVDPCLGKLLSDRDSEPICSDNGTVSVRMLISVQTVIRRGTRWKLCVPDSWCFPGL